MLKFASLALALLPLSAPTAPCAEEPLYRAGFTIEISLGDSFFERLEAQGEQLGEDSYGMLLDPVRGGLHFTASQRRIDMPYGPLHCAASIVDRGKGELMLLDYDRQTGWSCPLSDVEALLAEQGLPVISAEQVFLFWDEISAVLDTVSEAKRSELGQKEIAGLNCRGLHYKAPFSSISQADGIQIVPSLPVLRRLEGDWEGTFWISETHGLPVKMQMSYCGLEIVWQLGGFTEASGGAVLFSLPRLYQRDFLDAASLF